MARTTILVPKKLWFRAARNAAYTKNRLPHSALGGKVQRELLKETNIEEERKFLRTFGERVYAHILEPKNKLAARSTAARIIGYTNTHFIYLFNPIVSLLGKRVEDPSQQNLEAARRVLEYLWSTKSVRHILAKTSTKVDAEIWAVAS
jgi:hypothetical protein